MSEQLPASSSTKPPSIKRLNPIRLLRYVLLLTSWWLASSLVLSSALYLLNHPFTAQKGLLSALDPSSAHYLFSALPLKGQILGQSVQAADARVLILEDFLKKHRSPMVPYHETAAAFVRVADQYNLPWTLLPAICGKESGFGKAIPLNSHNCFGWGVYTGQSHGVNFDSWADSIQGVGRGLRENYFNRGLATVDEVEYYYTPVSASSHHQWRDGVNYFMQQLENWKI